MKLDHRNCDRCGIEFEDSIKTTDLVYLKPEKLLGNWYKEKHSADLCNVCTKEFMEFMGKRK